MGFDYSTMRDETVEPAIEEYGDDGQVGVNDASTGAPYESQLGSETLHPAKFLSTEFKKETNRGTLIEKNDVLLLMSTRGITIDPELAHRIIWDSVTYQVIRIDPKRPGTTVMFWYVHARK